MSALSNYSRDAILDHICNTTPWTAPSQLYLALLKSQSAASDTTAANAAKEVETPGANGYARQACNVAASASGIVLVTNVLTFGPATADWAEITHAWIVDSLTGGAGNIIFQGALDATKTVANTGSLIFAANAVRFLAA